MTKKSQQQVELEDSIARAAREPLPGYVPQGEIADAFTGEIFVAKARNHYEDNDGKPVAPPLDLNRPSIRQRIENLLNRDPGILSRYMQEGPPDGSEGIAMDVPDDPEEALTPSEQNYVDVIAAELAEQAPLPDDGLPRPDIPTGSPLPEAGEASHAGDAPGGGSPPASREIAPAPVPAPPAAAPAPRAAPSRAAPPSTVRTR